MVCPLQQSTASAAYALHAGVLPQASMQAPLPVLVPPDMRVAAEEQMPPRAASATQLFEQHQLQQPREQQPTQQQQQHQQAGFMEQAQHSPGYNSEDFALPPLQGGGGGFPSLDVGEHLHMQVRA